MLAESLGRPKKKVTLGPFYIDVILVIFLNLLAVKCFLKNNSNQKGFASPFRQFGN